MPNSGVPEGPSPNAGEVGRDPLLFPSKPDLTPDGEFKYWDDAAEEDGNQGDAFVKTIEELQKEEDAHRVSKTSITSLERFVMVYIQRLESSPSWRAEGVFHPSEIASQDACERFEVFVRRLPKPKAEVEEIDVDRFGFFSIGKAIHKWWQNEVLGKARVLKGTWECTRCEAWVRGFMPNHPCRTCAWPKKPRTWRDHTKQRPKPKLALFDKGLSCETICRWPGGYENPKRDCASCEWGGAWVYVEPEVEHPELELFGHCDGILELDSVDYVLELKSKSQFLFQGLEKPDPEHVLQANAYMKILGVHKALIPYVNKGNGRLKTFEISYDPKLWEDVEVFVETVQKGVKTGKLPEGCCKTSRDKNAKACPYREECFSGYETIEDIQWSLEKQAKNRAAMAERRARLMGKPLT